MRKPKNTTQQTHSQRGSVENPLEPRFLVIGQITKPHGVRGELCVAPYTDVPERFTWLKTVYVGETNPQPVQVVAARLHGNQVLLKLTGCEDRNTAESLRGEWLQVPQEEAIPLKEGEYYLYQLQGLAVYDEEGNLLGTLVEVLETKANNVFVVKGERGEVLIPDTAEVVKTIDFENGRITIHVIPGLLP